MHRAVKAHSIACAFKRADQDGRLRVIRPETGLTQLGGVLKGLRIPDEALQSLVNRLWHGNSWYYVKHRL
jgi:hypothetical protein